MQNQIDFPLHFEILGNPITKKNSQNIYTNKKTGRPFISPSTQYKKYKQLAGWSFHGADTELKINVPVNIKCLYYMETRRRVDLTNLLEATDDILVDIGILEDDNCKIIVGHDGSRVMYAGKTGNPRVEITIEPAELTFR